MRPSAHDPREVQHRKNGSPCLSVAQRFPVPPGNRHIKSSDSNISRAMNHQTQSYTCTLRSSPDLSEFRPNSVSFGQRTFRNDFNTSRRSARTGNLVRQFSFERNSDRVSSVLPIPIHPVFAVNRKPTRNHSARN